MNISFDITTLREGYLAGDYTPTDIIREVLSRIDAGDSKIWISVDSANRLLEQAAKLETKDPASLPLYGIPFAVKDNIDVANLPTTAACPDYRYFASKDAYVVALLRTAGAIPIGKTNLDQFATGLVGVRSPYGVPSNAFNPDYIPGGSSSGSAVSVALGQVSFSLGTDTAGSGRIPACFNNLIGLKPSRGLFSNRGVVPACKSLDCVSVFAYNAADAQNVFRIAASFDQQDAYSRANPTELADTQKVHRNDLRMGVPLPHQLQFFGDEDYQNQYLAAVKRLEGLGYQSKLIDIEPLLSAARLLYEGPWVAERYWAIRELIETVPDCLHPTTRAIIEKGIEGTAVDAFDAAYKLQAFKQTSETIWHEVDFLATPTAGTHYTIAEVEANPIQLNSNLGYYTNFMNLLDMCSVATPTGFTPKKLPFGITLIAPAFHDEKLLVIADRLQQASELPLGATENKRYGSLKAPSYDSLPILVCGAHMSGLPLNHQLTELGAVFNRSTRTASAYRLYALPGTTPPKPGMIRDAENGSAIDVEIWDLPKGQWAAFIAQIPAPLGIANIELADGSFVKGFSCEAWAVEDAKEVTQHASWRTYLETVQEV
ncbi:allophanate hydrolase [Pelagicoccus sp. SDUM812003]|uniref:allophanate hydrolase n=1 Tax=Pelagicoccus sp. SDUM812003 TaxID=3041267 RepID=UPI002810210F|nr:allophanate hydrolase [Pelagicoccus sp. SDUM812003]MDQ8202091.1 allophanate hydrolase [Pelagicoccus sp. SDUM812003]